MRDDRPGDRFEIDLRDALRLELASVRVAVSAPQVRGRIAARERSRRATRLVLVAAGLAVALLGSLVLAGRMLPPAPPAGAEPATVAAIDAASGDLVLSRAWPDGRVEETNRFPGGLERLREATGDATAALPANAVATLAHDGWLAVALPGGDVLFFAPPTAGTTRSGAVLDGAFGWVGWLDNGSLALVGRTVETFDPRTAIGGYDAVLPVNVLPDWTRGDPQLLTTTGGTAIVARRSDPAAFDGAIGALELALDPPTFAEGLPASVRAATGLEARYAANGSWPGSGCQDDRLLARCAGIAEWSSQQGIAPTSTWYVARANEALDPAPVRTADGGGLLVVARATDEDRGRVIVVDAPGSWREAFTFDVPAADTTDIDAYVESQPYLVGVAPGGRTVALRTPAGLLVGDLATGATTTLPSGMVFVGWPTAPVVATDRLAGLPSCEPATAADANAVRASAAGVTSPASAGALAVVGSRDDADPFRRAELAGTPPIEAEPGGILALALPDGVCAEAAVTSAVPATGDPGEAEVELGAWPAGHGTIAGLVPIVAPPPGTWVVRVTLWLDGADREAILLYRVRVDGG